jgi:large subunit ribosomal protein L23
MRSPELIIKRPLLTEKGTRLKDTGGQGQGGTTELDPTTLKSQLLFEVARDANKVEIRAAVEKLWNVDVVAVRTSVVRGKEKRMGRFVGKRSNWKKAIVTIAAGQTVEFFEGV